MTKRNILWIIFLILALSLTACANLPGTARTAQPDVKADEPATMTEAGAQPAVTEQYTLPANLEWVAAGATNPIPAGTTFDNAWDYCQAIGTIDAPGAEFTGSATVPAIRENILLAMGIPTADGANHNVIWRCVDNVVYGCDATANQTCLQKMDLSTVPNENIQRECAKAEMANQTLPTAVTGSDTPYEWTCRDGQPVITGQGISVDEAGYNALIWFPVMRP